MGILRDTYIVNNNTDTSRISYEMSRKNDIEESQKQKEVIDKIKKLIKQYGKYDGQKCTRGFQMWAADFNKLLEILEDKEVSE